MDSIPLNVRNPLQLINFSPAVTKGDDGLSGQNVTSESRTNTWRINGAKGATTDIAIDGATDTTAYYNQAAGIPGVEAVQEYRVYTSAYAPEFGRTSGGTVSYALRSGTNAFHGSLFEYLRNSDLDADGFNADKAGQPIAAFRRNQFGGTFGGPVRIPKLYNGRNKTFFFVSYEGLRDSSAGSFTGTMPTALERTGNFSQDHGFQRKADRHLRPEHHATRPHRAGRDHALHPHAVSGQHRSVGLRSTPSPRSCSPTIRCQTSRAWARAARTTTSPTLRAPTTTTAWTRASTSGSPTTSFSTRTSTGLPITSSRTTTTATAWRR